MLKIAICEDEFQSVEKLHSIVNGIGQRHNLKFNIHTFQSGEEFISFCDSHPHYFDIVLLDILMAGMNGIQTAKRIQRHRSSPAILFLTSSRDYALDSYDVNADGYLLKPYQPILIEEKLLSMIQRFEKQRKNTLFVKRQQDLITFSLDDVVYFESNLRKISAHFHDGSTLDFYQKLSDFEEKIAHSHFIRVHRSYLVHLLYVKNIIQSDIVTTTNMKVPISKKYLQPTKDAFTHYIRTHI